MKMVVEEKKWKNEMLPFIAMVVVECINVTLNTLFKAATNKGMSNHVFVAYCYSVAAIAMIPAPFFSRKSTLLPPINKSIVFKICLLGIVGCTSQTMGYTGITYSSPTLASAICNLVPAFTFILALIFRMEKVKLKRWSSRAKVIGTIVSVAGAFVVTLYKGPSLFPIPHSAPALGPSQSQSQPSPVLASSKPKWIIGGVFLTIEYILVPMWYIIQTQIMKEYPTELTVVFFYNICGSILGAVFALILEPNLNAWKIKPDISLISILCSGIFGSFINNALHTWVLRLKGPVFVAMFKPLSIAIAVALGFVFLADTLYLGSAIGAIVISIGFYTVMWGKSKEETDEEYNQVSTLESQMTSKLPLL